MVNNTTNLELEEQINDAQNNNTSLGVQSDDISSFESSSDIVTASNDLSIENIEDDNNQDTSENNTNVNCLALTVKKDYSLSIIKHVFVKTWKTTWRVALSIFVLNFLSFFF